VALRPRRTRRRAVSDPLTRLLALAAVASTGGVMGGELLRVWRRGAAPLPSETSDVVAAAGTATRQTVEVAVEGYRSGTLRENALFNLLLSFNVAWATARISAYMIRRRGSWGPFRNAVVGRTHVHHFVPGIALALLAGGGAIVSRNEAIEPLLAVPFGVGAALTLDESALLLRLDDVYWTEDGILSVQISLASLSLVSAAALAARVLRRGERRVLDEPSA
jgi:hypothetical protein